MSVRIKFGFSINGKEEYSTTKHIATFDEVKALLTVFQEEVEAIVEFSEDDLFLDRSLSGGFGDDDNEEYEQGEEQQHDYQD